MGAEVQVEIGADDVRLALAEAFAAVTVDRLGENPPDKNDVVRAISSIGTFLNALTDEQISLLNDKQQEITSDFLGKNAERFRVKF
jgi:hypothetical protein